MAVNDYLKRLLVETIANNINEVKVGFDGTPATSSDGSPGKPAPVTLTPTVKILDSNSLLVEATLPTTESYDETSGFTPVSRHVFAPILKTTENEIKIQLLIEVK